MVSAHDYRITGPDSSDYIFVFAHGAGGGMDAPFMAAIAEGLSNEGIRTLRFEFPYMAEMRRTGKRRPPDRPQVLTEHWLQVIAEMATASTLVIGGKSMGGRVASLVADGAGVAGLVCLGYPFHPPGRPEKLRTEHLAALQTPTLFLQGERDPFGTREQVRGYSLSPAIRTVFVEDGDHSFVPRASSGRTALENLNFAAHEISTFIETLG